MLPVYRDSVSQTIPCLTHVVLITTGTSNAVDQIFVPGLDRVRGAIVVSGKNLCLSVTQFSVVCNSETVEEIDTKLVFIKTATPKDKFCIENIFARSRSRSANDVTQPFVSGLYLKHFLTDTCTV